MLKIQTIEVSICDLVLMLHFLVTRDYMFGVGCEKIYYCLMSMQCLHQNAF